MSLDYYLRHRDRLLRVAAEYRQNNPEKAKAAVKEWYSSDSGKQKRREYFKTYCKTEPFLRAQKKYSSANKDKKAEYGRKYIAANPGMNCAKSAKRRAARIQRTPAWLSPDDRWMMGEIYKLATLRSLMTGIKFHVDHVIPLIGKNVSGLHTPFNLQVIQAADNLRKYNRYC